MFVQRTLVKTIEIIGLVPKGKLDLQIVARIEILQQAEKCFRCNVWFVDSYRIAPTDVAVSNGGQPFIESKAVDKLLVTLEDALEFDELIETTAERIEVKVLEMLKNLFTQADEE